MTSGKKKHRKWKPKERGLPRKRRNPTVRITKTWHKSKTTLLPTGKKAKLDTLSLSSLLNTAKKWLELPDIINP